MGVNKVALKAPSGMLKIVSLILCIIVLIICRTGFNEGQGEVAHGTIDERWLNITATGGYTVILGTMILTYLLGDAIADKMELIFMLTGTILFIAMGSLMIENHDSYVAGSRRDTGLAAGSLAIITGIVMFIDVCLIAKAIKSRN